jgi:hypothetical protein
MQLHDEQGVARRPWRISPNVRASDRRPFHGISRLGDLIQTCGMHVWVEMNPPVPDAASAVFAGIEDAPASACKLIEELDAFYGRGAHRLRLASRDRELVAGTPRLSLPPSKPA